MTKASEHPGPEAFVGRELESDTHLREQTGALHAVEPCKAPSVNAEGRVASEIAHELNNLLTVVIAHAALAAQHGECSKRIAEHLDRITLAGRRAAALSARLLAGTSADSSPSTEPPPH